MMSIVIAAAGVADSANEYSNKKAKKKKKYLSPVVCTNIGPLIV